MSTLSSKERSEVSELHGFSNRNGAQGHRNTRVEVQSHNESTETLWRRPATQIVPPSNTRPVAAQQFDFSKRMMMNPREPPRKKQRIERGSPFEGTSIRRKGRHTPPLAPESLNEVIIINDDDGDGMHSREPSTDEMNLHTHDMGTSSRVCPPQYTGRHKIFPPTSLAGRNGRSTAGQPSRSHFFEGVSMIARDGESTVWLEKQSGELLEDPIDGGDHVPRGTVQSRVKEIEQKVPPRLDLSKVQRPGVKKRMKPNLKSSNLPNNALTSTTQVLASSESPSSSSIIVGELYIGLKKDYSYELRWERNRLNICGPGPEHKYLAYFDVDHCIDKITYTKGKANEAHLLKIVTLPEEKLAKRMGYDGVKEHFKPGEDPKGTIICLFRKDSHDWNTDQYNALTAWLKSRNIPSSETVLASSVHSVWEGFERSVEIFQEQQQANSHLGDYQQQPSHGIKRNRSASEERGSKDIMIPFVSAPAHLLSNSNRKTYFGQTSEGLNPITSNLRRSTRNPTSSRPSPAIDGDEVILVYPQGVPGAVNITNADLSRLQPGEFLNDTLIEFGLKLWLKELEKQNPELARQVHVFSSFFYKKLCKRKTEDGYESVRKWTSKFDLFEKKYIIVPINEHLHWYLAIIYEPEHVLIPDEPPTMPATRRQTRRSNPEMPPSKPPSRPSSEGLLSEANDIGDGSMPVPSDAEEERSDNNFPSNDFQTKVYITKASLTPTPSESPKTLGTVTDTGIDIDEPNESRPVSPTGLELVQAPEHPAETKHDKAINPASFYAHPPGKRKGNQRAQSPVDVDMSDEIVIQEQPRTYIFTLDSLGTSHGPAIKHLTKYLKLEAKDKKNIENAGTAIGKQASVPVQPNFCDCGIYLLHLAQTFISDPARYRRSILASKKNMPNAERQVEWNDKEVAGIRQRLYDQIQGLSVEWKRAKEEARKNETREDAEGSNSDDDIDIVETDPRPGDKGKRAQRQKVFRGRG